MKKKETPQAKTGLPRLLELAGPRKKDLTLACLLSLLSTAARLVPFFTIYGIVREIVLHYTNMEALNASYLLTLAVVTAAAAILYGICSFTSGICSHRAAFNILYELRVQLLEKLGRLPSGYFTHTTQGALKKLITSDVEKIEEFIAHHIADTVSAIALPLLTFVFLFVMDWRLGLATLLPFFLALFLLAAGLKHPDGAETQKKMFRTRERMNGTIVEYVHGMPVVKIFNRTIAAFSRFGNDIENYSRTIEETAYFFAPRMGVYYASMGAQLLFILPASLVLLASAPSYQTFLPMVFLFFLVGAGLKEPLENMMIMALSTKEIGIGVDRMDALLQEPELSVASETKRPVSYDITFDKVSFAYDNREVQAVDAVSFVLPEGPITGLAGPSGGGKSTIASLLLHFYEVQGGSIKIGGIDIRSISSGDLMEMIGYVFQDSVVFQKSIEENIRMGNRNASFEDICAAAKAANIHDVITRLPEGYATVLGEKNTSLSGGEKQRIAIARVFLKNPPIIILDEATAYADAENESIIQESFARLTSEKTVLVIAHRLKTIQNADKILLVDKGRLVSEGAHETLLQQSPLYQTMIAANERRDAWSIRQTIPTIEEDTHEDFKMVQTNYI
ncbi:MAG: ABC transporter ATP-binding protein [Lachnospiraceae bacterium]